MSIEQMVRRALESEADAVTPVADVEAPPQRGASAPAAAAVIAVGTAVAAVAVLVAATAWPDVNRAAEPVAPFDGVPELPLLWTASTGDAPQEVVLDPVHRTAYVSEA